MNDETGLSILLTLIGAALVVVPAWLLYPRGRELPAWSAAWVFGVSFMLMMPVLAAFQVPGYLMGADADITSVPDALVTAFGYAALPEELAKLALVWAIAFRGPRSRVRMAQDGAFLGVLVGTAFGLQENWFYIAAQAEGVDQLAFMRVFMSAPGHALYTAIAAHWLVLARLAPRGQRARRVGTGLAIAIAFHGGFDAVLMVGEALGDGRWFLAAPLVDMGAAVAAFLCMERARRLDDVRTARRAAGSRGTGATGPTAARSRGGRHTS